ncbi:MAG TPA: methyltransferase domain-containing protein [Acidobacteriaceae bacterium]|nr:methyltransferase domain-containing protein [Acidobacteriaceae bacterium]
MSQTWSALGYAENGRFVADLGAPLLDLLAPQPGERILDLGCGDGALTEKIAASGARVIGVDASEDLLQAARTRGLDVRFMDGQQLSFHAEFDAVFSNAALHWMKRSTDVVQGVRRALKPGGRFVAEFGGHGNVAAVYTALLAVFDRHNVDLRPHLLFFPTAAEYQQCLEDHGFRIESIVIIPRPTPLPTGMAAWFDTFASGMFVLLPEADRVPAREQAVHLLQPILCDTQGHWTADYVRLRFAARIG